MVNFFSDLAVTLSGDVRHNLQNGTEGSKITGVSAFDIIFCALLFYAVVRILVVARAQSHQKKLQ